MQCSFHAAAVLHYTMHEGFTRMTWVSFKGYKLASAAFASFTAVP